MRFRKLIKTAGSGLPVLLVALAAEPAPAQFREIVPQQPNSNNYQQPIEINLTPTRQQFVSPRIRPMPQSQPSPSTKSRVEGTPTLAVPLPEPAELTPVVVVELKPDHSKNTKPVAVPTPPPTAEPAAIPVAVPAKEVPVGVVAEPAQVDEELQIPANPFAMFQREPSADDGRLAPGPNAISRIEPLAFNQVVPGRSSTDQIEAMWGGPAKKVSDGHSTRLIYKAPGFKQIDVSAIAGDVESILIHLSGPTSLSELVDELDLSELRPVEIGDGEGASFGVGYPERGVLLTYSEGGKERVSHIVLEAVNGEVFRLRAEADFGRNYTECLSDLEHAARLNPEDAKAFWMQAELLSWAGRHQDAWDNVKIATRIRPDVSLYQLTKAWLNASNGELEDAMLVTRSVVEDESTPAFVRARAECQLGDLLASGPEPEYEIAMTHHLKSIDLAAKYIAEKDDDVRRMAKDVLIDAHLAIAQDIALGNFQRQSEVIPKWLTRATELTEDFISDDQGEALLRMKIYRTTLAIYSVMDGNFDASIATEEAMKEGHRLVAEHPDALYRSQTERELAESLYHAAKIEQRCGRIDTALRYANNAVILIEGHRQHVQPSLFDHVMQGQLYFMAGSLYAVHRQDHAEAVKWYEKCLPAFDDERLASLVDGSVFGDLFVSMGVSYWESGSKEKAIQLTHVGAELMQQGVQAGTVDVIALSVPYGNLSAMHRQHGNTDEATHFATMLAKIEKDGDERR